MKREQQDAELIAALLRADPSYIKVRVLADGSVACLCDLLFTRAILLGVDTDSWESRFCFKDRNLADSEFDRLTSDDDIPAGFIARRR